MVERQPHRPSESELKGAILRSQAGDYLIRQRRIRLHPWLLGFANAGFSVAPIAQPLTAELHETFFDEKWKLKDIETITKERELEGINPSESLEDFINRRYDEFSSKND